MMPRVCFGSIALTCSVGFPFSHKAISLMLKQLLKRITWVVGWRRYRYRGPDRREKTRIRTGPRTSRRFDVGRNSSRPFHDEKSLPPRTNTNETGSEGSDGVCDFHAWRQ